jgi:hypothetical protein
MEQLSAKADLITIESRLPVLRDRSTRWLWNAFQTINNKELVKKVINLYVEDICDAYTVLGF